ERDRRAFEPPGSEIAGDRFARGRREAALEMVLSHSAIPGEVGDAVAGGQVTLDRRAGTGDIGGIAGMPVGWG
ncbi:MAG: hypothetical protein RIF44_12585, partial [Nitratireductor sp.]